jgi:protein-tyrosine phosphatase
VVTEAGLLSRFEIDSAGTGAWHVGERPDPRAIAVANRHGVALPSHARQITEADLARFDWIIAMDRDNLRAIEIMADAAGSSAHIRLLRDFDPDKDGDEVPDPYYGGASGFDVVYDMVARSCDALFSHLRTD